MAYMAQLQEIIQLVEQSLDEAGLDAGQLASRACLSRFHFDRLASAALGEPPGAFRRRLLLERAAHRLVTTTETIIAIGQAAPRFRAVIVDRVAAGAGGETFLDATCQPPQVFTLGGVLAHVLTFAAVRRTLAVGALESSGIGDLGAGDPMRFVGEEGSDASGITRNFE